MKNPIQIALVAFMLIFAASCGDEDQVKVVKPEPKSYCHVEMVYTPLTSSVIAIEYRVQAGQKPAEIVQMHKTDPNMVGGPFLDYTEEMFFEDNPEIKSSKKSRIRKDKCDPEKLDTVYYKTWNLEENDLVYLRIPARLDTVPGEGWNAEWFDPEKASPIKHLVERTEVAHSNLEKKPEMERRHNPCEPVRILPQPIGGGGDDSEGGPVLPSNGDSGSGGWWSDPSNWLPLLLGVLMLGGFIVLYRRIGDQHEQTRGRVSAESNETRNHVANQTRKDITEAIKNFSSEIGQVIKDEGKENRDMLERQLNEERKSQKARDDQFFKLLNQQGKGPRRAGGQQ